MPIVIFFISLLWPFAGLLYGARYFNIKQNHFYLYFFFIFGAMIILPYEHGDIIGYLRRMELYSLFSFSDYLVEIGRSLRGEGMDGFELFLSTNTFLVSRFTTNIHVSFLVTTTVFYLAWIRIIRYVYQDYSAIQGKNLTLLLLLIAFSIYIFFIRAINARFYLAYWVFILSAYEIIINRNHRFIFLALTTIFIHQSYIFTILVFGLYYVIYSFNRIRTIEIVLFALIVAGTIYSELGLSLVSQNLELLGDTVENRYVAYTKDVYIEGWLNRDRAWFQVYRGYFLFYTLVTSILLLRFNAKIKFNEKVRRLYYFFLIFWAANAFTFNIASLGERYRNVLVGVGILLLFKIFYYNNQKRIPWYLWFFFAAFLLSKLVTFRIVSEYLPVWIFTPLSVVMNYFFQPTDF